MTKKNEKKQDAQGVQDLDLSSSKQEREDLESQVWVKGAELESVNDRVQALPIPAQVRESLKDSLNNIINMLGVLKKEIEHTKVSSLEKSIVIKNKVDQLLKMDVVHVDSEEYERSEQSVNQYIILLDGIISEIDQESLLFSSILDGTSSFIYVYKENKCSCLDVLQKRIKRVKRYIKEIKKDLDISYSRYCIGFDSQMQKMFFAERYSRR